ncbi:cytochrome P450 [Sanghuangporus baumii]|uniref:Cytochrome P450 n=1 Tax=Sanghuangporus baumii TaxID=108892 RepID=A0A9Q5NAW8_SANBA|nr:cytochrome P450 [Sanghuangporus baumii]
MKLVAKTLLSKKNPLPLPPGPKPKPFIGNLKDLPLPGQPVWTHWTKHKDLYGPISSVTVFGKTLIVLNDSSIAFELLDKRSAIFSSRPRMVFGEMVGLGNTLVAQAYSERFRAYQRAFHAEIGPKSSVARFNSLQELEVGRFLLHVLKEPDAVLQRIRTMAGAIILKISHGYAIEHHDRDPLVDLAEELLDIFTRTAESGAWIVDMLPFLRHIPAWVPGMTFKRTAARWRKTVTEFTEVPYAFVKRQLALGIHTPSYTSSRLEKGNLTPEDEFIVKWTAMSIYAGGADTTVAVLQCFFLAMTVYPEVQRTAQKEIDIVVGNDRLPNFGDRQDLPYIDAIVKEVLRWHPVVPLGFPHASTEDDVFEGYFIPKGALIIPNVWWFTHDPKTYHDPMTFKPERFLGDDPEMDPHSLVFGFGRRSCPGREFAYASIYLTIAQTLAVFNIDKFVEDGKVVESKVEFTRGMISHPLNFRTNVKPRNKKAEALIRSVEEEHPFTTGDAKILESLKT